MGGSEITAARVRWPHKRQIHQDKAVVLDILFLNSGAKTKLFGVNRLTIVNILSFLSCYLQWCLLFSIFS